MCGKWTTNIRYIISTDYSNIIHTTMIIYCTGMDLLYTCIIIMIGFKKRGIVSEIIISLDLYIHLTSKACNSYTETRFLCHLNCIPKLRLWAFFSCFGTLNSKHITCPKLPFNPITYSTLVVNVHWIDALITMIYSIVLQC